MTPALIVLAVLALVGAVLAWIGRREGLPFLALVVLLMVVVMLLGEVAG